MNQDKKKCDECGCELPPDTEKVADPYLETIHGKIVMMYLCGDCYKFYCDST